MDDDEMKFETLKKLIDGARQLAVELGARYTLFDMHFDADNMSPVIASIERPRSFEVQQTWPAQIDHCTSGRIENETISVLVTERSEPIESKDAAA